MCIFIFPAFFDLSSNKLSPQCLQFTLSPIEGDCADYPPAGYVSIFASSFLVGFRCCISRIMLQLCAEFDVLSHYFSLRSWVWLMLFKSSQTYQVSIFFALWLFLRFEHKNLLSVLAALN